MRRDQPLYRDTDEKVIAGVCSGLGRYFDVDDRIVRVVFVVLAFIGFGGIVAYIVLWILVKPAPPGFWDDGEGDTSLPAPDVPGQAASASEATTEQ